MRTKEEIDRQIDGLNKMRSNLPEYSRFGDNNWENIDAQIDVILGVTTLDDYDESKGSLFSAAMDAERWRDGDNNEDLFDED